MKQVLIIDLNNLAHRCFHTPQGTLTTKQGEPSGVILGVLNSIKGMLEQFPDSDRVYVCFDGGKSEWRKALYPAYKAQRDYGKNDEEKAKSYEGLWNQMDVLYEFMPKIGLIPIKIKGQEADDDIAALCKFLPEDVYKIVITSDKDMLQLVSDKVNVYSPYKKKIISPLNFYEETGVTHHAYIGFRALLGDSSDNISGVPGIGEVTAKNLMGKYGHIDNILGATGSAKTTLMKSARTKKIFDPQNLQILGINNKLMSFNYAQYDVLEPHIKEAINTTPSVDSKAVRQFLVEWQFASVLSNYLSWILPFKCLE